MDSLDEYERYDQIIRNMAEEHVGRAQVLMAIRQLSAALDANRWIWQWGDGYGGWVKSNIATQVEALGLTWNEPVAQGDANRERILQKYGHVCANCGWGELLQIDHIHPRAKGGGDEDDNLQVLCAPCNLSKCAKSADEWEQSGDAARMRERGLNEH